MIPGRRDSLAHRVARIEGRLAEIQPTTAGPLSRIEQRELAELEAARSARFSRPIDAMDQNELDAFMAYHCNGASKRLAELRERARSPEERAESRAVCLAIAAMDRDALDEFMEAMASCSPEPAKGDRPCP